MLGLIRPECVASSLSVDEMSRLDFVTRRLSHREDFVSDLPISIQEQLCGRQYLNALLWIQMLVVYR